MKESILENNFLDQVEKFVEKKLHRKKDLYLIIEKHFQNKGIDEFEDFTFTGKYVNGLFRVLQSSGNVTDFQNLDQVKKDLNDNVEKVTSRLREITLILNENDKAMIDRNYLELTKESFQNIRQLAEDLDHIKKYLNYLKRK
jgi:hypothetical protein